MTQVIRQFFLSTLITREFAMNLKSLFITGALIAAASSVSAQSLILDLNASGKDVLTGNHLMSWAFDAGTFNTALLDFSATLPGNVRSVYLDTSRTLLNFDAANNVWEYHGSITGGSHTVNVVADNKLGMYTFAAALSSGAVPTFTQTTPFNVSILSSVPEPETYAMMLAGLGALGFVGRRRKAQAK
jgi:hypothetical protein